MPSGERTSNMAVRMEANAEVMTAYLSGEIDHHIAGELRETIDRRAEEVRPSLLILDFGDVTFMDSSGIGLVMGRYKLMQSLGGELEVARMTSQIRRVMKLAGLERLVRLEEGGRR